MNTLKSKTKKAILTQKGEISKNIINALNNCTFDVRNNKVYTGYYNGSGRYTTANDAGSTVKMLLDLQGYKYKTGNDSPRGGVTGNYIKLSINAFAFLNQVKHNNIK